MGALRHFKLERVGSILDKGIMKRRWIAYFNKFICYPVFKSCYSMKGEDKK